MDRFITRSETGTSNNKLTIGIIGTSGRKDDATKYNKEVYDKMYDKCENIILEQLRFRMQDITIISGGAPLSDHLSIRLFLKYEGKPKLILELPCEWDNGKFKDTGSYDWKTNPGRVLNKYHSMFSKKVGLDSLAEIDQAIKMGAKVITSNGFFDRNCKIAQAEWLIAFTFGPGPEPKDGGTGYTWKHSKTLNKIHVSISTLLQLKRKHDGKEEEEDKNVVKNPKLN